MISGISNYKLGDFNQAALDNIYTKAKDLYKNPTPPVSGELVDITVSEIWADSQSGTAESPTNTGNTTISHSSYPQTVGAATQDLRTAYLEACNMWCEVELGGRDPFTECDSTTNLATNTRVELGLYRGFWMDNNKVWHTLNFSNTGDDGMATPNATSYGPSGSDLRNCTNQAYIDERAENWNTVVSSTGSSLYTDGTIFKRIENLHTSIKPEHYTRWHGFGGSHHRFAIGDYNNCRAVVIQLYSRLIVEDTTKPDDRHLANYVVHVGIDDRFATGAIGPWNGIGVSRFKRITNAWTPCTLVSKIDYDELVAYPPPFISMP